MMQLETRFQVFQLGSELYFGKYLDATRTILAGPWFQVVQFRKFRLESFHFFQLKRVLSQTLGFRGENLMFIPIIYFYL